MIHKLKIPLSLIVLISSFVASPMAIGAHNGVNANSPLDGPLAVENADGSLCGVHPPTADPYRYSDSTSATSCTEGDGNPGITEIQALHPFAEQIDQVGQLEDTNGTNQYLTANSAAGWGSIPNNGSWAIDPEFWVIYESAVITIHVGHKKSVELPDYFAFEITPNALSGNWLTEGPAGSGGGLSNIKLWGVNRVPEPAVIALFLVGFAGMAFIRRRKR
jgi:hypothetical protein